MSSSNEEKPAAGKRLSLADLTIGDKTLSGAGRQTLQSASRQSLREPAPPEETEDEGTTQEIMAGDLAGLESAFARRAKEEADRFTQTTDSEHWFAMCFDSREQKEAFLKALGWVLGTGSDKYLDGVAIAQELGIPLPPTPKGLVFYKSKPDKTLDSLSRTL